MMDAIELERGRFTHLDGIEDLVCASGRGWGRLRLTTSTRQAGMMMRMVWQEPCPVTRSEFAREVLRVWPGCPDALGVLAEEALHALLESRAIRRAKTADPIDVLAQFESVVTAARAAAQKLGQRTMPTKDGAKVKMATMFAKAENAKWKIPHMHPLIRALAGAGRAAHALGDVARAQGYYAECLRESHSDGMGVRFDLVRLLLEEGDVEGARSVCNAELPAVCGESRGLPWDVVTPHMCWTRLLLALLSPSDVVDEDTRQVLLGRAMNSFPAIGAWLLGRYGDLRFPFTAALRGMRRCSEGLDGIEGYVLEFGPFWTVEALHWLASSIGVPWLDFDQPPRELKPPPPRAELEKLLGARSAAVKMALLRESHEEAKVAFEALTAEMEQLPKEGPLACVFQRMECEVLQLRLMMLGGDAAAAHQAIEGRAVQGPHVSKTLISHDAFRIALADEGAHRRGDSLTAGLLARRQCIYLRQGLKEDETKGTRGGDFHTDMVVASAARHAYAGAYCQHMRETVPASLFRPTPPSKEAVPAGPLEVHALHILAMLRRDGFSSELVASRVTVPRLLYSLPPSWLARAGLVSFAELIVVADELMRRCDSEQGGSRAAMAVRMQALQLGKPADISAGARQFGLEVDDVDEAETAPPTSPSAVPDWVQSLGAVEEDRHPNELFAELPEIAGAAVPGTVQGSGRDLAAAVTLIGRTTAANVADLEQSVLVNCAEEIKELLPAPSATDDADAEDGDLSVALDGANLAHLLLRTTIARRLLRLLASVTAIDGGQRKGASGMAASLVEVPWPVGIGGLGASATNEKIVAAFAAGDLCFGCGMPADPALVARGKGLSDCGRCKAAKYCSRKCQKKSMKIQPCCKSLAAGGFEQLASRCFLVP